MVSTTAYGTRTCVTVTGSCENMITRFAAEARRSCRRLCVLLALTLRLVVFLSVLRPGGADKPYAGVRQQFHDVASRTIQANLVLEGRVDRVMTDQARVIVRVLTVFKDRRLRRRAMSVTSTRLRVAVDFSSLADTYSVAEHDNNNDDDVSNVHRITSTTSLTRGARLIVFLRHRHTDAVLTYYVTSGGRHRRRKVDLFYVSALPTVATKSTRKTVKKYCKRRNGKYNYIARIHSPITIHHIYLKNKFY